MDKAVDKVIDALTQLAQKAGSTVENIFPILVRQAYLEGWLSLAFGILLVAPVVYGFRTLWRFKSSDKYNPEFATNIAKAFSVVVAILGTFVVGLFVESGILRILNPEYYAIKLLLNTVSGAVGK